MKEAKAFSPSHITGFFQIFDQTANSLHAGSRGAGVSLIKGVETHIKIKKASKSLVHTRINGAISNSAEVSEHTVRKFLSCSKEKRDFEIFVEHHVEVPIGAGFGTSGAAALGLALALNEAFESDMSRIEAAQIAHMAEIECKTGLGTVIAETFGGLEIRVKPGAPGIGEIKQVPFSKDQVVACLTFETLSTKNCLSDEKIRRRINELGGKLVDELANEPKVASFLTFSRWFADNIGLETEKVRRVLRATDADNFVCSMPMFGQAVFTLVDQDSLEKLLGVFRNYGSNEAIIVSEIDHQGARLL